jgi:hypothetical protein
MSDDIPIPPTTDPLDESGGRALVEAWRASGLTGAAFCRERNIRTQRLQYWRERLGYPIKVAGHRSDRGVVSPAPPTTDGFVQVVVSGPPSPVTTYVDIVVGAAFIRVHPGFDGGFLRSVVEALTARA